MTDSGTIIILGETCLNLVERYTPLVEELRWQRPQARLIGFFAGFELGRQTVPSGGLFAETHFFASPEEVTPLLRATPHGLLLLFVSHIMTFRDARLYAAAGEAGGGKAVVFRNSISLKNYLTSGADDHATVAARVPEVLRVQRDIELKAQLMGWLTSAAHLAGRVLRLFWPRHGRERILFIKLDVLGDMVVTIPYIAALRRARPDAELTVLASTRGAAILREQTPLHPGGLYDRLETWNAPWHFTFPKVQGLEELAELVRRLPGFWRRRYDTVIQPVHFGTGTVLALLTLAKRVVAVVDPRLPLAVMVSGLVSDPVPVPTDRVLHMHEWANLTLAPLGIAADADKPGLLVDGQARERVLHFLKERGVTGGDRMILFNIGAGHPLRAWGGERFARLAEEVLRQPGRAVVLTGSGEERGIAAGIEADCVAPLVNAVGEISLNELVALAALAELVVTVDTGVMHLAAAVETPIVAIFGAGLVESCRPLNRNHIIVKEELGCSGCIDRCFVSGYPPCLQRVTVDKVLSAVEQMLATTHGNN